MPSIKTLLTHQRLVFLQEWVARPEIHKVYITALLGKFSFEDSLEANPWTDQFYNDICSLEGLDECEYVVERTKQLHERMGSRAIKVLFVDSEVTTN